MKFLELDRLELVIAIAIVICVASMVVTWQMSP